MKLTDEQKLSLATEIAKEASKNCRASLLFDCVLKEIFDAQPIEQKAVKLFNGDKDATAKKDWATHLPLLQGVAKEVAGLTAMASVVAFKSVLAYLEVPDKEEEEK